MRTKSTGYIIAGEWIALVASCIALVFNIITMINTQGDFWFEVDYVSILIFCSSLVSLCLFYNDNKRKEKEDEKA